MNIHSNLTPLKTENIVSQSDKPIHTALSSPLSDVKKTSPNDTGATKLTLSEGTGNRTGKLTQDLINKQNDISSLQTTDEALSKIHSMLQQGKELAIQASTTQNVNDKQSFQIEINKLNQNIDHISTSIAYNNQNLSENDDASNNKEIIYALKSTWLEQAENVIQERYGLTGDGADLKIVLDQGRQPYLAAVYYNWDETGKATNQAMHIAVQSALPATLPNGGSDPAQYDDRVITHEMVHAVMGRSMSLAQLPNWFLEGTAEFIHGPDERIFSDLARNGSDMKGATKIQNALGDGTNDTWVNNSLHYSAASMAVRYLHEQIKADGYGGGIRDLLTDLKNNPTENLDQALSHVSHYDSVNAFVDDFVTNGNGARFIHELDTSHEFVTSIAGGDTGAIGGSSVDGGPVRDAKSVIPDSIHTTNTPLKHFRVLWPTDVGRHVDSNALHTNSVDLVKNPSEGSTIFDHAISQVSYKKDQLSHMQNQLRNQASSINATTRKSSIYDATTIKETVEHVKKDLNHQSTLPIASLTNPQPERVLQILKAT